MSSKSNNKMVVRLAGLVVFMGVMAFASVPFYNWFCAVTGYAGTTARSDAPSTEILDQTITIRFDANVENGMAWEFKPLQRVMELRIGEVGMAYYEAYNPTDRVIAGSAGYNVAPFSAGNFFSKIDCFCFEMQVLQPGERVEMPVTFYVDPEIVNDLDGQRVHSITLSYTFYETELPEQDIALAPSTQDNQNTQVN
ncbi:MAG: cytochrome c oxidase assembly protein [Rhodobacteraceae bacterium]|nr:cytochrome c oxidase assembly protein [Paracoccaceae bacterium]